LSRCKKWDAQGGKSKALFAKTMDGRFIIKQINRTEFESFIEFAPDYFKHVYHSLDTGSQTCLAKILGIYQVLYINIWNIISRFSSSVYCVLKCDCPNSG
jgi:1-phosphatidylinositol-3-phosphate 5-kinase